MVNTSEPIISTFTKKIDSQSDNKSWESIVYISDADADFLPRNINHSEYLASFRCLPVTTALMSTQAAPSNFALS